MGSRLVSLLALLCGFGCGGTPSNRAVDAGSNGPCIVSVDDSSTVTVDGWCIDEPTLISADAQAVFALDGVNGWLLRIDKSTGARTTLNGHPNDSKAWAPATDTGSEIIFSGCPQPTPCGFYAVPRNGGDVRKVADFGSAIHGPVWHSAVVADSTSIYWIDWDVWSAPLDGSGTPLLLGPGPEESGVDSGGSIAVDDSALFVTLSAQNVVERIGLDGSGVTTLPAQESPGQIVAAGGALYWTDFGTLQTDCTPTDGSVETWSGTGQPTTLASGLAGVSSIAVMGDVVVWTALGALCNASAPVGSVEELSATSSAMQTSIASNQLAPGSLVSDGTNVFWTVTSVWDDSGAIVRASLP